MDISSLPLPAYFKEYYQTFPTLTPIQKKAINAGLLHHQSLLICAPTASGKTLVATMAIVNLLEQGKAIYLVPLKALAHEKFKEFQELFKNSPHKVTYSVGDMDSPSSYLASYDLLILTTEKLDSLLRHQVPWLPAVKLVVIDEIHLLNDPTRGPTLEIILTLLKTLLKPQLLGLSATIGNPQELAKWLGADLVRDSWRPVELKQGIHVEGKTKFYAKK
ncbi:MAG: helicase [archaeon GW2011_AR9]|nr:MAG: helicase [archaeon GW2011_AR9]MBS3120983.1 DEAD/DEAH box helicase [Candidatus Woesearchaeota archaeon]HIH13531.1 DEAD/DEAH box helicase [Candidatus Woesearchaeota archaeon]